LAFIFLRATNKGKTNPSGLAFFAYYRVFARVPQVFADCGEIRFCRQPAGITFLRLQAGMKSRFPNVKKFIYEHAKLFLYEFFVAHRAEHKS